MNLLNVYHREELNVSVKRLKGDPKLSSFTVKPSDSIQDFIDCQLFELSGKKSDDLFLVYTGKQLDMELSFQEEVV